MSILHELVGRLAEYEAPHAKRPSTVLVPPHRMLELYDALIKLPCGGSHIFGCRITANIFRDIDFA